MAVAAVRLRFRAGVDVPARLEPPAHRPLATRGTDGPGGGLVLGAFDAAPALASLQGDIHPIAGGFSNCVSREEPSGNTINGFAVQRFASIRLTAALTLLGFSSAGCPVDGAIGAGLTYTLPLESSLWLVASAGVYGVPGHAPYPPRQSSDVRLDVTRPLDGGGTVTVGVGRRGISVGRAW